MPAKGNWRPFEEAREHVRSLGLKNQHAWNDFCSSGAKPEDIPRNPHRSYKDAGWEGYGDWLGTKHRKGGWRSFEEARKFVRSLGLKDTAAWEEYAAGGDKPIDIPSRPGWVYRNAGWRGLVDWLGSGGVERGHWRPFEEARESVRELGLKNQKEWVEWAQSSRKPRDIPAYPNEAYAKTGWISWGDWLGTGYVANQRREYLSFEEAREFVRGLGLQNVNEWLEYVRSGQKPDDIPAHPDEVYGLRWKRRRS